MTEALDRLARILEQVPPRLADISEEDAARRPSAGAWSAKELIGHLIDSAANNHQRFVRGMAAARLEFPRYDQEHWVASQRYHAERWPDLVNLWLLYNRHLLHVLRGMPEAARAHVCNIGDNPSMTLAAIAADYVSHMEGHLAQVFERGQAASGS